MTPALAREILAQLDGLQLPATTGEQVGPDGTRLDVERLVRVRVRAHDTAIRTLIADALKRRRDIEEWAGRVEVLEQSPAEVVELPAAPVLPTPPIVWVAAALAVGASLALHAAELVAIAWLLVHP